MDRRRSMPTGQRKRLSLIDRNSVLTEISAPKLRADALGSSKSRKLAKNHVIGSTEKIQPSKPVEVSSVERQKQTFPSNPQSAPSKIPRTPECPVRGMSTKDPGDSKVGFETPNKVLDFQMSFEETDSEELPATQPVPPEKILEGVTAYVEVRTKAENRFDGVCEEMQSLGAKVTNKFTQDVTHVVFKDGKRSTVDKALKKNIPLVTVLWIDCCRKSGYKVAESLFPVILEEEGSTPLMTGKLKRMKSMQPKSFEEDLRNSTDRLKRKKKRAENKRYSLSTDSASSEDKQGSSPVVLAQATPFTPYVPDTPASALKEAQRNKFRNLFLDRGSEAFDKEDILKKLDFDEDVCPPTGRRALDIMRKIHQEYLDSPDDTFNVTPEVTRRQNLLNLHSPLPHAPSPSTEKPVSLKRKPRPKGEPKSSVPKKTKVTFEAASGKEVSTDTSKSKQKDRDDVEKLESVEKTGRSTVSESRLSEKQGTMGEKVGVSDNSTDENLKPRKPYETVQHTENDSATGESTDEQGTKSNDSTEKSSTERKKKRKLLCKDSARPASTLIDPKKRTDTNSLLEPVSEAQEKKNAATTVAPSANEKSKPVKRSKASSGESTDSDSKQKPAKRKPKASKTSSEDSGETSTAKTDSKSSSEDSTSTGDHKNDNKPKKNRKIKPKNTIVMTSLHSKEQDIVISVVKKLGGFSIVNKVCPSTTHVVASSGRRTLNVLLAISQGAWIVSLEWVTKSLEAGEWINEEPYEQADAFPVAQMCRLERVSAGPSSCEYKQTLLSDVGSIFISDHTSPPPEDIMTLVINSGGKISTSIRKADICIGPISRRIEGVNVTEKWLIDSISSHSVMELEDYIIPNEGRAGKARTSPEF